MSGDQTYFCYLYIKYQPEAWIGFVFLALSLFLVIKTLFQYIKTSKNIQLNIWLKFIYYLVFVWFVFFLIKIVISEILFWVYEEQRGPQVEENLSAISKYILSIDLAGVFMVQTVLALIPFNWMKTIIQFFKNHIAAQQTKSTSTSKSLKSYLKWELILLKFIEFYLIARLFFAFLIIPFLIVKDPYFETIIVILMLSLVVFQALVIVIILIIGMLLIKNNNKLKQLIEEQQIELMIKQYVILILCATVRFSLDLAFLYIHIDGVRRKQCYEEEQGEQGTDPKWKSIRIINLITQNLFTHFLPIAVVLRLFKVKDENLDLQSTMLGKDQSEDNI